MPKINGFEMLELLDKTPSVIFTTAFDEYAIKAFETSAVDYLLKPFTEERFEKAISKWKGSIDLNNSAIALVESSNKQPDEHLRIVVKDKGVITVIPIDDVFSLEAYDDYVKVHVKDNYFLKKKTMNYFEQTLSPKDFVRIHRSFIININHLTKIEAFEKNNYRATLTNGNVVPISRTSYSELKNILGL